MSDEQPARVLFKCEYCDEHTAVIEPTVMYNALEPDNPHDWWMVVCKHEDCGVAEPIEDDDLLGLLMSLFDCNAYEAVERTLHAVYLYTQEVE